MDGVHHEAYGFALPPRTIVVGEDVGIRRLPENRLKGENLGDKTNGVVIIEVVSHVQRSTVAVVDFRTDRRFYPDDTLLVRTAGAGATSRPGVGREQLLVEERKPLDDGQVRGCRDEIRGVGAGGQLYGSAFRDRREFSYRPSPLRTLILPMKALKPSSELTIAASSRAASTFDACSGRQTSVGATVSSRAAALNFVLPSVVARN